jgi:hypothetical protein
VFKVDSQVLQWHSRGGRRGNVYVVRMMMACPH